MVVFMTLAFQRKSPGVSATTNVPPVPPIAVWITYVVFQNWRTRRKGNITPRDMSAVDIQLLARMIAFTVFEVVLVVYVRSIHDRRHATHVPHRPARGPT